MKPALLFIWFMLFTLSGCLRVLHVNTDDSSTLAQLNEHAAEASTKITFIDGQSFAVTQLVVRPDSTSWFGRDGASRGIIATSRIQSVKIKQKTKEVVPLGALLGGTAGALWSYNTTEGTWYRAQTVGAITILSAAAGWGITSAIVGPRRALYRFMLPDR